MKLALIGYGKMGRTIEQIAVSNGDEVCFKIDKENQDDLYLIKSEDVDVAIEFSNPESAYRNLSYLIKEGIPVVSGTTGWLDKYDDIALFCKVSGSAFMYASNYSIGVNIFFELNKFLADKMKNYDAYRVEMEEIHHTEKLDAPSGTARTLAEDVASKMPKLENWKEIGIISQRIGKTPGTHVVSYESKIDNIEIKHTAHSRLGFAQGAYEAARWLKDKKGVYSIQDMLFG